MKIVEDLKKILHVGGKSDKHAEHIGRVLVLDGMDVVGHRVVERLIEAEYTNLRVGMRKMHDKEDTRGVELVPFVWEDMATYDAALKDVKTVFVTLPTKPDNWDAFFPKFLKTCESNKVKRIVKLSFNHSIKPKSEHPSEHYGDSEYVKKHTRLHEVPLVYKHALCDGDLVRHGDLSVTLLNATHLMSNVFRCEFERKALTENKEFYGASDGKGVNYVSPNDVATAAVKAIMGDFHHRRAFSLLGPSAITDEDVAKLLSESLGSEINYVEKPLDFFDKDTAGLESIKASGVEENFPMGDLKKLCGKDAKAETFKEYLAATKFMTPVEQKALDFQATHVCKGTDKGVVEGQADEEKQEKTVDAPKEEVAEEAKQPEETPAVEAEAEEDNKPTDKEPVEETPESAHPAVEAQ